MRGGGAQKFCEGGVLDGLPVNFPAVACFWSGGILERSVERLLKRLFERSSKRLLKCLFERLLKRSLNDLCEREGKGRETLARTCTWALARGGSCVGLVWDSRGDKCGARQA